MQKFFKALPAGVATAPSLKPGPGFLTRNTLAPAATLPGEFLQFPLGAGSIQSQSPSLFLLLLTNKHLGRAHGTDCVRTHN